jgi:hypothetical protein
LQHSFWITRPGLLEIIQTLLVFHFGYDNQAFPPWLLPVAIFLTILIPAVLLLEGRRLRQRAARPTPFPAPYFLLLCLALGPVILTLLISQITPIYTIRAMLPSGLAYGLLAAALLFNEQTPKVVRWGILGPALLVALASLVNHYQYDSFPRSPFDETALYLQANTPTGAVIVHSNKMTYFPTYYYDPDLPQKFIADEPGSPSDTLAPATQTALGHFAIIDVETAVAGHDTVWFVLFQREWLEYEEAGRPHPDLVWLQQQYRPLDEQQINDLWLFLFERD